jgi:hypothetical protein
MIYNQSLKMPGCFQNPVDFENGYKKPVKTGFLEFRIAFPKPGFGKAIQKKQGMMLLIELGSPVAELSAKILDAWRRL